MRISSNSPYLIPINLIDLQKKGQVIFFCGAGISLARGLPSFYELTQKIVKDFNIVDPWLISRITESNNKGTYEYTLDLLNKYCPDFEDKGRNSILEAFRQGEEKIVNAQGFNSSRNSLYPSMHDSLLRLSFTTSGLQVVTTNFDDFFENTIKKGSDFDSNSIVRYYSPYLPLYRDWTGIVYLHGLLSEMSKNHRNSKHDLILTSEDMGKAYISENWAAKFLKLIFSEYHICFVGYSLSDPTVKYLVNALSDIREQKGKEMFALNFPDKKRINLENTLESWKEKEQEKWKILEVETAIFDDSEVFSKVLSDWVNSNEKVSSKMLFEKLAEPVSSIPTKHKEYLLYQLASDEKRVFENLMEQKSKNSITLHSSWINEIFKPSFTKKNLRHFGFSAAQISNVPDDSQFSLQRRPFSNISSSQPLYLCNNFRNTAELTRNHFNLARWLVDHLDHPSVLKNLIVHGPFFHPRFKSMLRASLPGKNGLSEGSKFIYELLLAEKLFPQEGRIHRELFFEHSDTEFYSWKRLVEKDNPDYALSIDMKERLRKSLSPCFKADCIDLETSHDFQEGIALNQAVYCGASVWKYFKWISEEFQSKTLLESVFDIVWSSYLEMQELLIQSRGVVTINKSILPDFNLEISTYDNGYNHEVALTLILYKILKKLSNLNPPIAAEKIEIISSTNYPSAQRIVLAVSLEQSSE